MSKAVETYFAKNPTEQSINLDYVQATTQKASHALAIAGNANDYCIVFPDVEGTLRATFPDSEFGAGDYKVYRSIDGTLTKYKDMKTLSCNENVVMWSN